ncbi:MAG: sulfotransferase domain-containing protein [Bacteroidia bacterium]
MNYIFITGLGRSGTSFISALLSKIRDVHVGHEDTGSREFWLLSWYLQDTSYATEYLLRKKKKIEADIHSGWYIDSDSYLQNATDDLQKVFKPKAVFHLARNPKEVVRSIYTRRNENDIHLLPKEKKDIQRWMDGNRFEQVCWNWRNAVENLLDKNVPVIKLEELTEDYNYFNEKLLKPFGFTLEKNKWEEIKNKKVNKTRSALFRYTYAKVKGKHYQPDVLPDFPEWPDEYKKIFTEYCFPAMKRLGYSL